MEDALAVVTGTSGGYIVGGMVLLSVLVQATDGFRVYQAIVPDVSREDPQYTRFYDFVMRTGYKARTEDALKNFPSLKRSELA